MYFFGCTELCTEQMELCFQLTHTNKTFEFEISFSRELRFSRIIFIYNNNLHVKLVTQLIQVKLKLMRLPTKRLPRVVYVLLAKKNNIHYSLCIFFIISWERKNWKRNTCNQADFIYSFKDKHPLPESLRTVLLKSKPYGYKSTKHIKNRISFRYVNL